MQEKVIAFLTPFLESVIVFVVGILLIKALLFTVRRFLKKSKLDISLYPFIINSVKIVLWIIFLIVLLGTLGVPSAPFIAVLGAVGAAIALALQDSLGNIAGGLLIIINNPFKKDDIIELGGIEGLVEKIDLLHTDLRGFDNKKIRIPNGLINTSILTNFTREETRRVDCRFGVSYTDDITKVKEVLRKVAESNELILKEPELFVGVVEQADNCVKLDLRAWCKTADYYDIKYYLEEQVKLAFDDAGISIPFPQMDVHIKNANID